MNKDYFAQLNQYSHWDNDQQTLSSSAIKNHNASYHGPVNYYSLCKHTAYIDEGDSDAEDAEIELFSEYGATSPLTDEAKFAYTLLVFGYVRMSPCFVPDEIHHIIIIYTRVDPEKLDINVGDTVLTRFGRKGVVRFKGGVHWSEYERIGIEMDVWAHYANNGIIHGHKYMTCVEGRGIFI